MGTVRRSSSCPTGVIRSCSPDSGSGRRRPPTREERQLFAAIPQRRTNRHPFEEREVPILLLRALDHAAASEGAWLDIVTDSDDKRAIAELIATGDRIQGSSRDMRREL